MIISRKGQIATADQIKSLLLFIFTLTLSSVGLSQAGCTSEGASNYDPQATINDGSCLVWDCAVGPYVVTFTREEYSNSALEVNQDRIAEDVWISRNAGGGGIYNAFNEEFNTSNVSPTGTLWKFGTYDSADDPTDNSVYMSFRDHHGNNAQNLPNEVSTLYLVDYDMYYQINWLSWTCCENGGGFSYTRTFIGSEGCTEVPAVYGCQDPTASNFDSEANLNDNSCLFEGCTNPLSCNYDANANSDDGSCLSICPGCNAENATNYDPNANEDDGSCLVWDCYSGPLEVTFTKENYADNTLEANQDRITDDIWLTRANQRGLFNAFNESSNISDISPEGTLWKLGTYDSADDPMDDTIYRSFREHHNNNASNLAGETSTLYLINYGVYFEINWISWTCCENGGGFSYTRTFIETEDCNMVPLVYGCVDTEASNFDSMANTNDGSCLYEGCTDPMACNYDTNANSDNGSCLTVCMGCTLEEAPNYDPIANEDDGSCTVWDCYVAPNYVEFSKEDYANTGLESNQDRITENVWITRGINSGLYNAFNEFSPDNSVSPAGTLWKFGTYDPADDPTDDSVYMNFRDHHGANAQYLPGETSTLYIIDHDIYFEINWLEWTCCENGGGFSYTRTFIPTENCTEINPVIGCADPSAMNYDSLVNVQDDSCLYGGCTDTAACNFDSAANVDDGSCLMVCPGCTIEGAFNYDPNANDDDGSCFVWDCYDSPYYLEFTKEDYGNVTLEVNQDRIMPDVWLTRAQNGGLFNAFSEDFSDQNVSPAGTVWKLGTYDPTDDPTDNSIYQAFRPHHDSNAAALPGQTSTLYLVDYDLYFEINWTSWTSNNNGGGLSYTRTFIPTGDCTEVTPILGCADPMATNYNSMVNIQDDSCMYEGCTDAAACNFNELANVDDGSCVMVCPGCTIEDASNYDPSANEEDGSCMVYECFPGPYATMFLKEDYADAFLEENQDRITDDIWITRGDGQGLYNAFNESFFNDLGENGPANTLWKVGSYDVTDDPLDGITYRQWRIHADYNPPSLVGTTSTLYLVDHNLYFEINWLSWTQGQSGPFLIEGAEIQALGGGGIPQGGGFSYERIFVGGGECPQIPAIYGCTSTIADNYSSTATLDDGTCVIMGCTDPEACTYNADATEDDESCLYTCLGCTTEGSANYDPQANEDDGSCEVYPCFEGDSPNTFTKNDFANSELEENQDRITDDVWLTRGNSGPMYNAFTGDDSGTLWKLGAWEEGDDPITEWDTFYDHNSNNFSSIAGETSSVYLVDHGIVFNVFWLNWTCCENGGGVSYIRTFVPEASGECDPVAAIYGCTHPEADNYDEAAQADNGLCIISGCTDELACNYNPEANFDDESCILNDGNIFMQCPEDIEITLQDNQLAILVDYDLPVLQGACEGNVIMVSGQMSGSEFGIGTTTNLFQAVYEGEIYTCSFNVVVDLVGCLDSEACNYNPNANVDSENCTYELDPEGLNCPEDITVQLTPGNQTAAVNYPLPVISGICDAEVEIGVNLFLQSGLLPGEEFPEGTTAVLWNFNDGVNDFSCGFDVTVTAFFGCTNPLAANYNPDAAQDDGSCVVVDCNGNYEGPLSLTFTKEDFADWTLVENQDRITDNVWLTRKDSQGLFNIFNQTGYSGMVGGPSNTEWYLGTTDTPETFTTWVDAAQNDPSTYCNNDTEMVMMVSNAGLYFDVVWHSFTGSNNGGGFSYTRTLNVDLSGCNTITLVTGCTDEAACNYDSTAVTDDGSCILPVDNCSECEGMELVIIDTDEDGVCDAEEIAGCTSDSACNYNAEATDEDESCLEPEENCSECEGMELVIIDTDEDGVCDAEEIAGCTSDSACNYNAEATDDDESCIEPIEDCFECNEDNTGLDIIDSDEDGVCDGEEVLGCTNPECENYDSSATEDDGSCENCIDSVLELNSELLISFYPNPVQNEVTIQLEGVSSSLRILVRDALGKEVYSNLVANAGQSYSETVDLKGQGAGLYFVTIQSDIKNYTYKIVKE